MGNWLSDLVAKNERQRAENALAASTVPDTRTHAERIYQPKKVFDIDGALGWLKVEAKDKPTKYCASYVVSAMQHGGANIARTRNAKDYGPNLVKAGMKKIDKTDYVPQKGDVAVIQPYPGGNPSGHMQMYDGDKWVSDHVQDNEFYPSKRYEDVSPPYEIYRQEAPAGKNDTGPEMEPKTLPPEGSIPSAPNNNQTAEA